MRSRRPIPLTSVSMDGFATESSIPVSKLILKMSMSLDGFVGRRQRRQRIHLLLHVRGRRHRAEAVFIGGNGFRATRAVHHLECRTGRLVLEANQVLPWSVLENAGAPVTVRGFGTLFDDRQPDGNKTEER